MDRAVVSLSSDLSIGHLRRRSRRDRCNIAALWTLHCRLLLRQLPINDCDRVILWNETTRAELREDNAREPDAIH